MSSQHCRLKAGTLSVELDLGSMGLIFQNSGVTWQTSAVSPGEIMIGGRHLRLADAGSKRVLHSEERNGPLFRVVLGVFPEAVGLELCLEASLNNKMAECSIVIEELGRGGLVEDLRWPGPILAGNEAVKTNTILPYMQGMLLPADWPRPVIPPLPCDFSGRRACMNWWGQTRGRAGHMILCLTPDDAGYDLKHPAGGPTQIGIMWHASMKGLRYARRLSYRFFDDCNYVTMAHHYRKYLEARAHVMTLREKMAKNPKVAKLNCVPVISVSTLWHCQPESRYYNSEHPEENHKVITFAQRANDLERLHGLGVRGAYVHLDGWGKRGYDNLHPDILPPAEETGGWDGLRHIVDSCHRLGYLIALHDQYRDYYRDSADYTPDNSVLDKNGVRPVDCTWPGGEQDFLCAAKARDFIKRNHTEIQRRGIAIDGVYLDVFSIVPGDECHHPLHPSTRGQCLAYRNACFDYVADSIGIVSSEEPTEFSIDHLDLVHHGPYHLSEGGGASGIPIPLWNLVFHDCLILPWNASLQKGGCGCPDTDVPLAHAALNAGMPYLSIDADPEEIERVKRLCELQARVAFEKMVKHELLDENGRRQKTVFANGISIEVNLDTGFFNLSAEKNKNPASQ